MPSTQNIFDTSVLPQSASTAEAEQGGGATAIVPPSEIDIPHDRGGNSAGLHVTQETSLESDRHSASPDTLGREQKRNGCVAKTDMPRTDAETAGEPRASAGRFDASVNRMIEITDDYLNEIEAEREGGDIEHSGYPYAGESRY